MRKRISWGSKLNPPPRLRVVVTLFLTLPLVLGACRPQATVETVTVEEPAHTEVAEPTLTPDPIDLLKGPLGIEAELQDEAYILTEDILAELMT